jgi:triphosphoribosyl-dephospho-CoA synthase
MDVTKGVNTQRGILFSAGILCGAAGLGTRMGRVRSAEEIFSLVKQMACGLVERELGRSTKELSCKTAGEKLYIRHAVRGIRGEVEAGFPSISEKGLPALRHALCRARTLNESLVHALLAIMTVAEDSTVLWRKGPDQMIKVHKSARDVLEKGSVFTQEGREAILRLDREWSSSGISPGGSADLLAMTAGLYLLENGQFPVSIL